MNCNKSKRWISDALDGVLSAPEMVRLDRHLQTCKTCCAYQKNLEVLRIRARELRDAGVDPQHMLDLQLRLKTQLSAPALHTPKPFRFFGAGPVRWGWGAAAAAVVTAVLILLFIPRGIPVPGEESLAFSLEESLSQIYAEIGEDVELERSFDQLLEATVRDLVDSSFFGFEGGFLDSHSFLESLSEEELNALEQKLKKDIES